MSESGKFLLGHARSADWNEALEQCLQQIGAVPTQANIGFLYMTDLYADLAASILEQLRRKTGVTHWVGTVGIGICATGKEYSQTSAMAVMIGRFPDDSFRILPFYNRAADNLPGSWDTWLSQSDSHVALLHGDPGNGSLPQLLQQLDASLPGGFLVGGLSSSHGEHPQIADDVLDGGLSGIVFNPQQPILTGLTQGCTPIADKRVISSCDNNVINRIDDRPALDVLKEDIGEILARDLNRAAGYIFAGLPIRGSDTGDYLVRNLVGVDSEGGRIAIGDIVMPGQPVQFCRRDGKTATEDMQRMLDELKQRLSSAPKGGVYVSCLGRGKALFGEDSVELEMIRSTLGDFPLVGFFANGEISNQRLYGYTGVLTLFL
ncbi:small ligand-binding sensory domain FIST [Thiogranum longum]|uniref:Small ligand-binding sensory domain FIST n=1 Tax=Thiogranum longum TaxID=1537524 RepID=A0A4V2PH63_9GAMM|nr:FIST C-terminal domain-containing protein [Thiogranum longum]TCK19506.1 small ligand-binding sensory domain FIST [Thiogranum longum]